MTRPCEIRRGPVMRGTLGRLVVVVLMAGLFTGCSTAGDGSPSPGAFAATVSSAVEPGAELRTGTPPVASPSADCITINAWADYPDLTLEFLASGPWDAVAATVVSREPAAWDSPTGQAPNGGDRPRPGQEFYIHTPFVVNVERSLAGDRPLGELTVEILGGEVGCSRYDMSPAIHLVTGARYVLFLKPPGAADSYIATQVADVSALPPMVWLELSIIPDGRVATPLDGPLSLDALAATLRSNKPSTGP